MEGACAVARGKDINKKKEGRRERRRREEGVAPGQEKSSESELHVGRKPRARGQEALDAKCGRGARTIIEPQEISTGTVRKGGGRYRPSAELECHKYNRVPAVFTEYTSTPQVFYIFSILQLRPPTR